jgi:hypothetical protein
MSTAKKGCRQGPASGERFHSDSTSTKIIGKSHRKNPTFYVFTLWLILYFVGIAEGRYRKIHKEKSKIDTVTMGTKIQKLKNWIVMTITDFF